MILSRRRLRLVCNLNLFQLISSNTTATNPKYDFNLCPQLVNSTIKSCPSDTVALSFFLWCARQRDYFHSPESFDRILPAFCRLTGRLVSVSRVIEELGSVGCPIKAQTFLILLRTCWQGAMFEHALQVFDEMVVRGFEPNTFAMNVVLDMLFKVGNFEKAVSFWKEILRPNFITYGIVLSNLCRAGDWWGVKVVLREMVAKGYRLNEGSYLMVFDCFHRAGRITEILQLLGFMIVTGIRLSVALWTVLIDSLCRAGRVHSAGELFQKMVEYGCFPNVVTYTSLIKGYLDSQMYSKVSRLLDAMLAGGCVPDLVLYNTLMDSLHKAGRDTDAINVFIGLRWKNLEPDSYTLSLLISVLCSSGKLSLFPDLVRGLEISLDLVSCNSLLSYICKAGFPYEGVKFYCAMLHMGFMPDSYTYAGLLDALCSLGRMENALYVYYEIVANENVDAYVHSVIFKELIKGGQHHIAFRLFREAMSTNSCMDAVCYSIVVQGLLKVGRYEEARSLYKELKQRKFLP